MRFIPALAAAMMISTFQTAASAEPYTLDKSHTAIHFTVDHIGFSLTHGFFTEFDADIDFDEDNPENSSVVFTVDTASVNTLWPERDKHVKNTDFLNVKDHKEIVFKSTKVEMTGEDTAKLTGELTIVGVTNEHTFDVKLRKTAPSPFSKSTLVVGFQVTGVIDRTDFGIDYAVPAVGSEIPVQIDLEINKKI